MKIEFKTDHNEDGTWRAETLVDGHSFGRGDDLDREGLIGLLGETIRSAPKLSWCVSNGAWFFTEA